MDDEILQSLCDITRELAEIRMLFEDRFYDMKKDTDYCCNDYFHCAYKNECMYSKQCKLDSMTYESED